MNFLEEKKGKVRDYFNMVSPVVERLGYKVYDVEYLPSTTTLRLYIMNPESGTADLQDCIKVDRELSEPFEETDWIPETIVLEVSSPGMYRHIVSMKHLEMSLDKPVLVVIRGKLSEVPKELEKKVKGLKSFRGDLKSFDENKIIMEFEGHEITILTEIIKKINLDPEF